MVEASKIGRRKFLSGLVAGLFVPSMAQALENVDQSYVKLTESGRFLSLNRFNSDKFFPDKFTVLFFGTSNNVSGCSADIGYLQQAAEEFQKIVDAQAFSKVQFVLLYPEIAGVDDRNIRAYLQPDNSLLTDVSGTLDEVESAGKILSPRALYTKTDGEITGHTRFVYLLSPCGQQLATFLPDNPWIADHIAKQTKIFLETPEFSRPNCPQPSV
jgi:hypothetical protein